MGNYNLNKLQRIFRYIIKKWLKVFFYFFSSYSEKKISINPYRLFDVKAICKKINIWDNIFLEINENDELIFSVDFIRDKPPTVNKANKKYSSFLLQEIKGIEKEYNYIFWEKDFISSYVWPVSKFYTDIVHLGPIGSQGADIKCPWELSRCQHFTFLIQNRKYKCVFTQMMDFISSQPPFFGPNWKSAMEVAIRAVNWLVVLEYLNRELRMKNSIKRVINTYLYDHYVFITKNFENYNGITNNHYLANLSGVIILANSMGKKGQINKYKRLFINEVKKQFHEDGTNFEGSTNYHRLSTELFFYTVYFITISDENFNEENYIEIARKIWGYELIDLLYKVFDSWRYILKPNGNIPNVGDNDSGRFIVFDYSRSLSDGRYLLEIGAAFFQESKWIIKEFVEKDECLEVLTLFGKKHFLWLKRNTDPTLLKNISSKTFASAGWTVMRDNHNYCFISHGNLGTNGLGGHDHDDKLSYELTIKGEDVVVDGGTYCYTPFPDIREWYVSVNSHNLPYLNKDHQNEYLGMFRKKEKANPQIMAFEEDSNVIYFKGKQAGFGGVHYREITWDKKLCQLRVSDSFSNNIKNDFIYNQVISLSKKIEIKTTGNVTFEDFTISPVYRIMEKAIRFKVYCKNYTISHG